MLTHDEVHVWRASLHVTPLDLQHLRHTLDTDELIRAERYYFQKDREQFIIARGLLRTILGRYLNVSPAQLQFCYGPYGKPALLMASDGNKIRFNLSHSHGLAIYAISDGRELGVDLELIRPDPGCEQIAERFFSPRERTVLHALPATVQREAFFKCWTRKEAYVKARGDGLAFALDRFDVSLAPGEAVALLDTQEDPQEASRWVLHELTPGLGYVAALAVEGHHWRLKRWQWLEWPQNQGDACATAQPVRFT